MNTIFLIYIKNNRLQVFRCKIMGHKGENFFLPAPLSLTDNNIHDMKMFAFK
jgi:hypothetical protein